MKKNFFKKLSFVLALAMIISALAPAAGAFAAEDAHLSAKSKTLLLGTDRDKYDFNIAHKQKGWKYEWKSSNEDVATVASNGLTTAEAIGTADISVVITKGGEEVATLTAPVTVKDNIKDITAITCSDSAQDVAKLAVAKDYTFARAFVTDGGSTTATTAKTVWSVNSDKATISASGVFNATEAGKYTITAMAFQSMDKYTAWKATSSASSELLLASKTLDVTVVAGIVSTKQINDTKVAVTFDSNMSKSDLSATTASVAKIVGGKAVVTGAEKIKSLSLDATGKVATVELFASVSEGATYNFTYAGLTGTFVAAKKDIANITGIVFDDFNASTSGAADLLSHVSAVNKDGVVIYTGTAISSYLTFKYDGDITKGSIVGTNIYLNKDGYQAPVTVTFNNYLFDAATSTYTAVKYTDSAVVTAMVGAALVNSSAQFQIVTTANLATKDADWKGTLTLAAKDAGYVIQTRYKTNANGNYSYSGASVTFVSSDESKLVINGNNIFAYAAGTVTVVVKDGAGNAFTTFDVVISAQRNLASVTADAYAVSLGNSAVTPETKRVTLTLLDTMGAKIGDPLTIQNWQISSEALNAPSTAVKPTLTLTNATTNSNTRGLVYVDIATAGATPGAYQFKIKATVDYNVYKEVIISVYVSSSTDQNVASWKLNLDNTTVSMKSFDKDVTVTLDGYNDEGAKIVTLTPGVDYTYKILGSDGSEQDMTGGKVTLSGDNVVIHVIHGVSGSAVSVNYTSYWGTNNYAISAYVLNTALFANSVVGAPITTAVFGVVLDKTTAFTVDKGTAAAGTTLLQAVSDAYTFVLNGDTLTSAQELANIVSIEYSVTSSLTNATGAALTTPLTAGQNVYVSKVVYRVVDATTGAYIDYEFGVSSPINVLN